jgi:zinc D-Ala-D-Ala carboxypeptidase
MTPDFNIDEFKCNCGCPNNLIKPTLLEDLQIVRNELNEVITITSGYRCPIYNEKVGGSENSSHIFGLAADLKIYSSAYAYRLMRALFTVGSFTRIGYGKLNKTVVLHVDRDPDKVPKVLWGY